jgi:hypothetical protein
MAGTIVADNIQAASTSTLVLKNGVANTPPTVQDSAGTQIGTFCRAWVNFNGTGTVAIRASFNVSSITDNGTGDYTINFTTAMPDANYSLVNQFEWGNPAFGASARASTIVSLATGSSRVRTGFLNSTAVFTAEDVPIVCVSIFR